jgi:hypothetical protein
MRHSEKLFLSQATARIISGQQMPVLMNCVSPSDMTSGDTLYNFPAFLVETFIKVKFWNSGTFFGYRRLFLLVPEILRCRFHRSFPFRL